MEDEDGESRSTDMWPMGERVLDDPALGNSLKHSNDDEAYVDVIADDRQLQKQYSPIIAKDLPARETVAGPRLTFKGFKKRILAEAQERHSVALRNNALEQQQLTRSNASTKNGGKERRAEGKHKITEYLGLQPSSRHRCSKCHGWLNCGPNSKQNHCVCNPSMTPMPSTSESASLPHASSNFKITRKVYLCAACGTYFENWNLFLHMRDIHKRHICLFCLGMFGQAERLLHHLSKKHNVPDLEFSSEDEFYSVFKGSCYLVCCSCERIFSETDNFYDHLCSPTFKQDATAGMSVCTLCRQTGTHASTCNFALSSDTDRESYTSTTPVPVAADLARVDDSSAAAVPSPEKIVNLGGKGLPRKIVKNNRSKHGAEVTQNLHQSRSNSLAKTLSAMGRCNKNQLHFEPDVPKELVNNLPRDTVSETIMEVSRYTGNSSDENDENDEQAMNKDVNKDKGSGEKSPAQNHQLDCNEPYDSVTETIMEVSRYTSDTEEDDVTEKTDPPTCIPDMRSLHATEKTINKEEMDISDKSDTDPMNQSGSPRAPSPTRCEFEETATADKKTNAAPYELGTESEFQPYDSPQDPRSPVSRSLFSPRHESHMSDSQPKESLDDFHKEEGEEIERPVATNTGESQLSVSFNAVPSSDRSLVIKICTNRNSQFSVTSAAAVSRGSEENNNAEGSTTSKEKLANGSDRQKDIVSDDQANDLDDSDSDSDKLAVVDSNPEEDEAEDGEEEGEEAEEADEVEETEDIRDDTIRIESEEHEGIGTGTFDVVETDVLSGDATEKLDNNRTEGTVDGAQKTTNDHEANNHMSDDDGITLAGEDALCMDLNVEGTLDSMELDELLKRCIEAASPICVYCNHARCIAVNGKQLGLHMLAEHKFQPQHPAIIIHAEQFTMRVKRSLDELEPRYFNLNTYDSEKGTYNVPQVRMYECFHCRFHSAVHKELYLHNRKMHQKTILICIMCKSTFYSYSELLCHLCPGVYSPNMNLRYRCCLCSVNSLPSSFRLMVHLRKQHHACDVCLESTGNQQRLSNHVWKHKLHHLCYRCGIAYRNKPDITKHLFWKHGTESVLCRKCVQKKWPHIYHFCIPPAEFKCDECECKFKRAVALKVHKRLHSTNLPYGCDECAERFISRKLLAKHQASHREPEPEDVDVNVTDMDDHPPIDGLDEKSDKEKTQRTGTTANEGAATGTAVENVKNVKEAVKRVVDVYDLPPLNLSSESDTDSDEEKVVTAEKSAEKEKVATEDTKTEKSEETVEEKATDGNAVLVNDIVDVERNEEEKKQEARIMDGIWDNFKTYAASLEMKEPTQGFTVKESPPEADPAYLRSIVLADHDYCVVWSENGDQAVTSKEDDTKEEQDESRKSPSPSGSPSHNVSCESDATKRAKVKTPKKKKRSGSTSSSDSSSDTDSSSCSCGTNCSCSSSSSGSSSSSSSSSDSDSSTSESSPRKQSSRRERNKKDKENMRENKSESVEPENKEEVAIENGVITVDDEMVTNEPALPLMRESDLETDETVTDEDFYDEHPQLLANTLLAEKRNQLLLLATVSTSVEQRSTLLNNGAPEVAAETTTSTKPLTTVEDRPQQKRKTKTKKRRKGERGNKRNASVAAATTTNTVESIKLNIPRTYYQKTPGFAASSPTVMSLNPSRSSTPNLPACNDLHGVASSGMSINTMEMLQTPAASTITIPMNSNQNVGSGSEAEKRSSKRKRVPKRFYGDSSDDEPQEKQQATHKWGRKTVETIIPTFAPPPSMPVPAPLSMTTSMPMTNPKFIPPSRLSFSAKVTQQTYRSGQMEGQQQALPQQQVPVTLASATESEGAAETSSESSESETEVDDSVSQRRAYNDLPPANETTPAAERPAKIYCYCQCPYDEVSEMIACDGEDCRIEWFHFECVGIMVPPKGKWYCPDCRRKHDITQNNDEYCD